MDNNYEQKYKAVTQELKAAKQEIESEKLKHEAAQLEKVALPIMRDILSLVNNVGLNRESYAIKTRVKEEDKLLEKVDRKRTRDKKSDYTLSSITDVIGLRLVSLFREDMIQLFRRLVELISHSNDSKPNPFQKSSFEEVIIYSPYEHDPLAVSIKLLANTVLPNTVEIKSEVSTEGYSSIHLVARASTGLQVSGEYIHVPIEIQIRTVFEDAWGEIDHKFRYSEAEGKSKTELNNPMRISENLKILKKFSDSCSLYADEIKRDASLADDLKFPVFEIYPVDTSDTVIKCLRDMGVQNDDIDKYHAFREVLVENCNDKTQASRTLRLVRAADGFLDLSKSISKKLITEHHPYVKFHFSMHAALCLLATYEDKHLRVALDIYESLYALDPENPMVSLRQAQTYAGLGLIDKSLEVFDKLKESMRVDNKSEYAHQDEYSHIIKLQPYMYGYLTWVKFSTEKNVEEKEKLIKKAINVTRTYDFDSDAELKNKYRNNILYYEYELALLSTSEKDESSPSEIRSLINAIEKESNDLDGNIDFLDSLAKAYFILGEYENSISYCDKIFDLAFGMKHSDTERDYSGDWELIQGIHLLKEKAKSFTINVK